MDKVLDYVVITSSKGIENFETLIKQNINLGWQPVGGVSVINATTEIDTAAQKPATFLQAMVRYDN